MVEATSGSDPGRVSARVRRRDALGRYERAAPRPTARASERGIPWKGFPVKPNRTLAKKPADLGTKSTRLTAQNEIIHEPGIPAKRVLARAVVVSKAGKRQRHEGVKNEEASSTWVGHHAGRRRGFPGRPTGPGDGRPNHGLLTDRPLRTGGGGGAGRSRRPRARRRAQLSAGDLIRGSTRGEPHLGSHHVGLRWHGGSSTLGYRNGRSGAVRHRAHCRQPVWCDEG